MLLEHPELQGRQPDVDAFADEYTTKVLGSFYFRFWNPTALGLDGFAHSWAPNAQRAVPVLYM